MASAFYFPSDTVEMPGINMNSVLTVAMDPTVMIPEMPYCDLQEHLQSDDFGDLARETVFGGLKGVLDAAVRRRALNLSSILRRVQTVSETDQAFIATLDSPVDDQADSDHPTLF